MLSSSKLQDPTSPSSTDEHVSAAYTTNDLLCSARKDINQDGSTSDYTNPSLRNTVKTNLSCEKNKERTNLLSEKNKERTNLSSEKNTGKPNPSSVKNTEKPNSSSAKNKEKPNSSQKNSTICATVPHHLTPQKKTEKTKLTSDKNTTTFTPGTANSGKTAIGKFTGKTPGITTDEDDDSVDRFTPEDIVDKPELVQKMFKTLSIETDINVAPVNWLRGDIIDRG